MKTQNTGKTWPSGAGGFSIVELLVVLVVLGIVTSFALMGIVRAKASFNLSNNSDVLKAHIEKAFADSRRRHAQGDARAKIVVTSPTTYCVTADFNGDGNPEARVIQLTDRVQFVYSTPPQATIDWRGKVAEGTVNFALKSADNESVDLQLSGVGDSSIDTEFATAPTITVTPTSTDVKKSAVVNGNGIANSNAGPAATPTPLPFCSGTQMPSNTNCRCPIGWVIDDKGKCKN